MMASKTRVAIRFLALKTLVVVFARWESKNSNDVGLRILMVLALTTRRVVAAPMLLCAAAAYVQLARTPDSLGSKCAARLSAHVDSPISLLH